jgi:alpha-amylase/alpha-mannosidase (GH57 family)
MRAVAIHAHFYQPDREDPWLGTVQPEPSASPWRDWNHRVTSECYAPNASARLLGEDGRLRRIVNNYRDLSFDVGPTLHGWLATQHPEVESRIRGADSGNAIAQAYHHLILPLACDRDIRTQVLWGASDFQFRFGRTPFGMWLPEMAVDLRCLDEAAKAGIGFVLLSPHQCSAVRPPGGSWRETPKGARLDVTRPYRVELPSGRSIAVFFHQDSVAREMAFGTLLDNGDRLAENLLKNLPDDGENRMLVVATDGETFGHHHRFGEMALARTLQVLSKIPGLTPAKPGAFLKAHPPEWEARILQNTSWSCSHGIERWRSDCGCRTGGEPGWHQRWREPLRKALDTLRDALDERFETECRRLGLDPWPLRDGSIELLLGPQRAETWIRDNLGGVEAEERKTVLRLLESQRLRMAMYTSCAWFFNDVAGLETRLVLGFALRALELGGDGLKAPIGKRFAQDLADARGNRLDLPEGKTVLEKKVLPKSRSLENIAASAAILALDGPFFSFDVSRQEQTLKGGELSLRLGEMSVTDRRTGQSWSGSHSVLSAGGLDDSCRLALPGDTDRLILRQKFFRAPLEQLTGLLEEAFPLGPWGIDSLPSEQRDGLARARSKRAEADCLRKAMEILDDNRRLIVQLNSVGAPLPPFLACSASFSMQESLDEAVRNAPEALELLQADSLLEAILEDAHSMGLKPELSLLSPRISGELERLFTQAASEKDPAPLEKALHAIERAERLAIELPLATLQESLWKVIDTEGFPASPALTALAGRLGFSPLF